MRPYKPYHPNIQESSERIKEAKKNNNLKSLVPLFRSVHTTKVRNTMRYSSTPNNTNYYMVNSHGRPVERKKFKIGDNRTVVFLSRPDTCISGSHFNNSNFLGTFFNNKTRLKLFMEGRMQYLKNQIWTNAYKRVYKAPSKVPNIELFYEPSMGVRTLPSGNMNKRFNKPRFLSNVVNSRPGVYFVFACRKHGRGKLTDANMARINGKLVPFKKHSHGNRMSTYENRVHRETFVKRKRVNVNNNNNRPSKKPRH